MHKYTKFSEAINDWKMKKKTTTSLQSSSSSVFICINMMKYIQIFSKISR